MSGWTGFARKGHLMAEETSHYAVVADDEAGLQLARLLDGYIAPQVARAMDLLMMMVMGGRERTLAELRSLMASEGYEFARDVPLGDSPAWRPWHVVEFLRQ